MLHGPEGRGKTQIALAYCERQRSKVGASAIDVFWVDATTRTNRLKGLSLLYYSIGLPPHQMNDEERARSVIRYLATSDLNWLLVYDGFGDERSSVSPSSIRECLPNPSGPGGTIIITTRSESCKELLQDYIDADFEIDGLDSVDSATLLLKRSGIEQTPASIIDAKRIAMLLNGKPPDILRAAKDLATVVSILGKNYTELLQHSTSFRRQVAAMPGVGSVTEDASKLAGQPPSVVVSPDDPPKGQSSIIIDIDGPNESSTFEAAESTQAARILAQNNDRHIRNNAANASGTDVSTRKLLSAKSSTVESKQAIPESRQTVVNTVPETFVVRVTRARILEGFRKLEQHLTLVNRPQGHSLPPAPSPPPTQWLLREVQSLQSSVEWYIDQTGFAHVARGQADLAANAEIERLVRLLKEHGIEDTT